MPRNVTSEGVGDDKLFDINTIGGKYTVNSEHFLCLKEDLCLSNIETYRELSVTMYHTIIYSFKTFKYDRLNFQSLIGAEQHIESQISDNIVEITFYDLKFQNVYLVIKLGLKSITVDVFQNYIIHIYSSHKNTPI